MSTKKTLNNHERRIRKLQHKKQSSGGTPGADGADGATGPTGADGADGEGVPVGGTAGQVLEKIDGTDYNTQWADASGGASAIDDLSDVTITTPADGEMLRYNGTLWINNTLAEFNTDLSVYASNPLTAAELGELQNIGSVTITNAQWSFLGAYTWPATDGTADQVLATDGAGTVSWATASGGVSTYLGLTDTPASFSGQALKIPRVNAGETAIEFVDPPANSTYETDMVIIDQQTASAVSQIDFTFDPSLYYEIELFITDLVPATTGQALGLQVSEDGGSTFKSGATDYRTTLYNAQNDTTLSAFGIVASEIRLGNNNVNTAGEGTIIKADISGFKSGDRFNVLGNSSQVASSSSPRYSGTAGLFELNTNEIDAIRLAYVSGNITSGEFILRGRLKTPIPIGAPPAGSGGGGPTVIASTTILQAAATTEIIVDSGVDISDYDEVYFLVDLESDTAATELRGVFRDAGADLGGTTYRNAGHARLTTTTSVAVYANDGTGYFQMGTANGTSNWDIDPGGGYHSRIDIEPVRNSDDSYFFSGNGQYVCNHGTAGGVNTVHGGYFTATAVPEGIRIYTDNSANIFGTVRMIGVKYSASTTSGSGTWAWPAEIDNTKNTGLFAFKGNAFYMIEDTTIKGLAAFAEWNSGHNYSLCIYRMDASNVLDEVTYESAAFLGPASTAYTMHFLTGLNISLTAGHTYCIGLRTTDQGDTFATPLTAEAGGTNDFNYMGFPYDPTWYTPLNFTELVTLAKAAPAISDTFTRTASASHYGIGFKFAIN